MDILKIIHALIVILPQILEFIKKTKRAEGSKKLSEKAKAKIQAMNDEIDKAFEERDAQALNDVFNLRR